MFHYLGVTGHQYGIMWCAVGGRTTGDVRRQHVYRLHYPVALWSWILNRCYMFFMHAMQFEQYELQKDEGGEGGIKCITGS